MLWKYFYFFVFLIVLIIYFFLREQSIFFCFQKGLQLIASATDDDKNGAFNDAMVKYEHAVEYLGFAIKCEKVGIA